MITIVSTTNRPGSNTLKMCNYLKNKLSALNQTSEIVDFQDLPIDFISSALFNNGGKNEAFNTIRDKVQNAEKLIFVIPEYNGSFPGILKAFIDGLKFPQGIKNKKAALIGISSGTQGSALAMSHFSDILNYLGCHVFAVKPRLINIEKVFVDGIVTDEKVENIIDIQLNQFIDF